MEFRNAISARLDGEELPAEAAAIDAHVDTCPDCAGYADRAARITRLTRIRPADPGPDLVTSVMAAAPQRRRSWSVPVRVALGGVAVGQFALALSGLVATGAEHGGVALAGAGVAHLSHESAAWNLALAIGFLYVAVRGTRSSGLVPVIGGFVGALAVVSALDVLGGGVDPMRLLSHVLVVVGLVLLLLLRRISRNGGGARRGVGRAGRRDGASAWALPGGVVGGDAGLRPTARHDAA